MDAGPLERKFPEIGVERTVDQLRLDAVYRPLLAISTAFSSACALFIDS